MFIGNQWYQSFPYLEQYHAIDPSYLASIYHKLLGVPLELAQPPIVVHIVLITIFFVFNHHLNFLYNKDEAIFRNIFYF